MPATTKGAWKLQEVRDAVLAGEWITYDNNKDPSTLWAFGSNAFGQVGIGFTPGTCPRVNSPIQVPGCWTANNGAFGVRFGGCLFVWGRGICGRLGVGDNSNQYGAAQVPGTTWLCAATGSYARAASMGLKTDGSLWTWGYNASGALGDNTIIDKSSPVQIPGNSWCVIRPGLETASQNMVAALKTDGTLWTWGRNTYGQLGNNTNISRSSPTQVPGNSWTDVAVAEMTMAATKSDGTLWTWGNNGYGQIGNNTRSATPGCSSPIQIPGVWSRPIVGFRSLGGIKTDGTLWGWGRNNAGELGDNTAIEKSSPVQVPGTQWANAYIGLGLKTDGTLWAWGNGGNGNIGNGTLYNYSSPVQIPGTKWISISSIRNPGTNFARKSL